ncbi:uncharacterized protein [Leptinotarsa decemlineata]|uniref:uncharacterized protein n=1 Tax=Leptinotarsa decemlineata TaxID=7539 RepID=UPI003D30BBAD
MRGYIIIFLCVLFVSVDAGTGTIHFHHSNRFRGYCFSSTVGSMENGEERRLEGLCAIAICENNGNIRISGCAPVEVPPPCSVVDGELFKPFPECCFEIECPKGHEIHYK